jgi:hypothetical protein
MLPVAGEALDVVVLLDDEASTVDKGIASASLAANAVTFGLLPNFGAVHRSGSRAVRDLIVDTGGAYVPRGARGASRGGSALGNASGSAFRAADDIAQWTPKNKHLLGGGSQSRNRFNTADIGEVRGIVQEALRSANAQFLPNPNVPGTFRVVTDLGRQVGTRGSHQSVRVIVGGDGRVINAFPVRAR